MSVSKSLMQNLEHDCTLLCKSINHGCQITSALTKRAVTDEQLAAYLNWICTNCGEVNDEEGRTALHLVASCGRLKLMKYLIHVHGANLNITDKESGCTALHRAVFYGQIHIAVNLIKLGAEVGLYDNGHLTAIDYAMRDRYPPHNLKILDSGEVYAWGSNDNYTLGIGNQQSRNYPDLLDVFRKENVAIKQVSLNKFHTIFLSSTGQVYTCGHGQGGRLGNGSENTVLKPHLIEFVAHGIAQESCVGVSAGRDHSLFVMESGMVWSCGLNSYSQLGHADNPKSVVSPKHIKTKMSSVQHVCASRFHSVAWGSKAVFTWGLNAGQLGHDKTAGEYITIPKKVMGLGNSEISSVASSDGATVIATSSGYIYVLHEFQCRKIGSKRNDIASVAVIGGHLSPSNALSHTLKEKGGDHLRILVLTSDGLLFTWTESSPQLIRCIYSLKRPLSISSLCISLHNIYLITELGEAFKGEFKQVKSKRDSTLNYNSNLDEQQSSFTKFLNRHECAMIKVQRIPNIYRAISIACDIKGRNCAVVQAYPVIDGLMMPCLSDSILNTQMLDLLENSSQEDSLHDITFKVGNCIFPAHKYIVFASEKIKKMCNEYDDKDHVIDINDISPEMFRELLNYMYTGTCDLLKVGVCRINFLNCENKSNPELHNNDEIGNGKSSKSKSKCDKTESDVKKDPIRQFQYHAKQFGLSELYTTLTNYRFDKGYIHKSSKSNNQDNLNINKFSRLSHPELLDATIKPTSGSDTKIIKAHRCILVARLEYFQGMFMHEWRENKTSTEIKLPYPYRILEIVIDFLYTDDWSDKDVCDDIDFICQLLIVADQLFITRLREMCEAILVKHITIKNVATFLQFASVYNAIQLQACCFKYIFLNIAALLENHCLEILSDEILVQLTEEYLNWNKYMSTRVLTPYSNAPSDEKVIDIYQKFYVDVSDLSEISKKKQTPKRKSLPRRISDSDKGRIRNESISEIPKDKLCESPKIPENILESTKYCNMKNDLCSNNDTVAINNKNTDQKTVADDVVKHTKEINIVQSRLKAIALTKNVVVKESFVQIVPQSKENKTSESHFPALGKNNVEKRENVINKSIETPKKSPYVKISQKQRKKQLAQSVADELQKVNAKPEYVPTSVWDIKTTTSDSFASILRNDQKSPTKPLQLDSIPNSPGNNVNILSQIENINNMSPVGSPVKASPLKESNIVFSDILADERQQRENYTKMKSKPLILTQIEDRAIEDLEKFYNVDEIEDELITIARVCTIYSSPSWIQK